MATRATMNDMSIGTGSTANNAIYATSILSIVLSLLMLRRNPVLAVFTGLWAPTILSMGSFFKENKILEEENRLLREQAAVV